MSQNFRILFAVPRNSVGIPVPTGIDCPLTVEGVQILASYICNLREVGAPDAEIEAVTTLARYGHFVRNRDEEFWSFGIYFSHRSFDPACVITHMMIRFRKASTGYLRARNCLRCFLGPINELHEIPDRYGYLPSAGRKCYTPQLPQMTVEIHYSGSYGGAMDVLSYEAAFEHLPSPPLRQLTTISQIAELTCDELGQYLGFYANDASKDAGRDTKLELLKKELGIDCIGASEFNGESLTEDERRAVASYFRLVGIQLTDSEAAMMRYDKVKSAGEELAIDPPVGEPCKMFRQQISALRILEARCQNLVRPLSDRNLAEVPDCYGNVPSGGRDVHIPAQAASRTAVHIPGVDRVIRYIVLRAIPEHPVVKPLPGLTRMTQVLELTPGQVNQYLKFYCVAVPEGADSNQRLALLKVELSIDHIGPAYIQRYYELRLAEMQLAIRELR